MTQIALLNGIYTDVRSDFRSSYPKNMVPVPKETGISKGYLRSADGMAEFANSIYSSNSDRGGINWQDVCYRVIDAALTRVNANGTIDYFGFPVANDGKRVSIVNSFDRLGIACAGKLYYYLPGIGVQQVTDPDLGLVLDVIWISGYFMTTDGAHLVVTDLNDPFSVNPLKYGSSEASPDPVNSLLNIRNEAVAINRYTTEFFQNVGGSGFPFQRIESAMIPKGSIGTHATTYFLDSFAFVGGGDNEPLSVYVASTGNAQKIATREIETILLGYTQAQLVDTVVEALDDRLHQFLFVHLPDQTLVYDHAASQAAGDPVWHIVTSGASGELAYRARNYVFCYGKWLFGDIQSQKIGYFTSADARQFGNTVPWQFDTQFIYNDGSGFIIHNLELVPLTGRQAAGAYDFTDWQVGVQWTLDGLTWSDKRFTSLGEVGAFLTRPAWRRLMAARRCNWVGFRFTGNQAPPVSFARLEAQLEALNG